MSRCVTNVETSAVCSSLPNQNGDQVFCLTPGSGSLSGEQNHHQDCHQDRHQDCHQDRHQDCPEDFHRLDDKTWLCCLIIVTINLPKSIKFDFWALFIIILTKHPPPSSPPPPPPPWSSTPQPWCFSQRPEASSQHNHHHCHIHHHQDYEGFPQGRDGPRQHRGACLHLSSSETHGRSILICLESNYGDEDGHSKSFNMVSSSNSQLQVKQYISTVTKYQRVLLVGPPQVWSQQWPSLKEWHFETSRLGRVSLPKSWQSSLCCALERFPNKMLLSKPVF